MGEGKHGGKGTESFIEMHGFFSFLANYLVPAAISTFLKHPQRAIEFHKVVGGTVCRCGPGYSRVASLGLSILTDVVQ